MKNFAYSTVFLTFPEPVPEIEEKFPSLSLLLFHSIALIYDIGLSLRFSAVYPKQYLCYDHEVGIYRGGRLFSLAIFSNATLSIFYFLFWMIR